MTVEITLTFHECIVPTFKRTVVLEGITDYTMYEEKIRFFKFFPKLYLMVEGITDCTCISRRRVRLKYIHISRRRIRLEYRPMKTCKIKIVVGAVGRTAVPSLYTQQ